MSHSPLCRWESGSETGFPTWSSETISGFPNQCSVKVHTLTGGMAQGMRVVDVCTGAMTVRILPDRGMGIWKAWDSQSKLGWESPVKNGPVHPTLVNQERRGGLGWLDGFDEFLCRCGLASVGPPGKEDGGFPFTLHGRIANLPAWNLSIEVDASSGGQIRIEGIVDECSLFDHQFRLTTRYELTPGSRKIQITDKVENLASRSDHMQLLYHLNVGRPILGLGAKVHAPVKELSPQTKRAAEGIESWSTYDGPELGFAEQVYLLHLHGNAEGKTLALLSSADGNSGVAVRFPLESLPCFTVWKNTGADGEGYVTGLEPATCFPNFRGFERQKGRMVKLKSGAAWEATWSIDWITNRQEITSLVQEINHLANQGKAIIHKTPDCEFTPQGAS